MGQIVFKEDGNPTKELTHYFTKKCQPYIKLMLVFNFRTISSKN